MWLISKTCLLIFFLQLAYCHSTGHHASHCRLCQLTFPYRVSYLRTTHQNSNFLCERRTFHFHSCFRHSINQHIRIHLARYTLHGHGACCFWTIQNICWLTSLIYPRFGFHSLTWHRCSSSLRTYFHHLSYTHQFHGIYHLSIVRGSNFPCYFILSTFEFQIPNASRVHTIQRSSGSPCQISWSSTRNCSLSRCH